MFDYNITSFLVSLRSPWLDRFFILFSTVGNLAFIWIIIGFIILIYKKYDIALYYFLVGFFTFVVNELILKSLLSRERPFVNYDTIEPLVSASGYSLPSSHAATSFAFATMIAYFFPRFRLSAYILAILISFSRVYVGVHYSSDIIVGAIIGLCIAGLMIKYLKTFKNPKISGASGDVL